MAVNITSDQLTGLSVYESISLINGAAEVVKATRAALYGGVISNRSAATKYVKFYNLASATVGTQAPAFRIAIPGNASDTITALLGIGNGMYVDFNVGLCIGASTGFANADTGAPAANDVLITLFFK